MAINFLNFKDLTPNLILEYKSDIINEITNTVNSIVSLKEEKTFKNVVQPLINIRTLLEYKENIITYVKNFFEDKFIRETANSTENEIKEFLIDCFMRKDLYNIFSEYQKTTYLNESKLLNQEENRYF